MCVSLRSPRPRRSISQIFSVSSRADEKAISLPSGDQQGSASFTILIAPVPGSTYWVRFTAFDTGLTSFQPASRALFIRAAGSRRIMYMSPSGSSLCDTKARYLPSGESAGEESFEGWSVIRTVVMSESERRYMSKLPRSRSEVKKNRRPSGVKTPSVSIDCSIVTGTALPTSVRYSFLSISP
ncbi:MAG: hypothetical protein BWY96_02446 [Spirochaetes bacterium ADurb.BinA120]|nr:MAG: hypothetical protein BWY96_02446 [Spirochaetes bacterium ADurb.BinA120]